MKKLSTLIIALLFTAGIAFGQDHALSLQNGNNNEVTVDQTYQSGGSGDANGAFTLQDGDNNKIKRLHQVGAGNLFGVSQDGDGNIVSMHPDQGDAQGGGASFDGIIQIHQSGNNNKVWDADQAGFGNEMYIYQGFGASEGGRGNNNIVNVEAQVNRTDGSAANFIQIEQYGDGNVVGGYGDNEPGAYQEGSGNSMDIEQRGGSTAGTKKYIPTGGSNGFTELQFRANIEGGQGLIQLGTGNHITLDQDGASSVPTVYQNGSGNHSTITQTGSGNVAAPNTAATFQVGTGNTSNITQN